MDYKDRLIPVEIDSEMKTAYIDYSMSVIVSRALPDIRDGLKPVHRRVLYGMHELGVRSNTPYKKSARIVGEVLGKYHPHGDNSIYDTMVRMAQEWNLRYLLVDGQGNFGSVDGDSPAAMRYTEARMKKISEELMSDIDKETVDFQLNFDDSLEEPTVLPTKIPNLLINGASGIAVGMATNMAPHNLTEVIDATVASIDNPDISIEELMQYIQAPDFPTGGIIYGYQGVKDAYHSGKGRLIVRAKLHDEIVDGKDAIVVTELPYQVNKSRLVSKTGTLINEKKLLGISLVRDESDRQGIRVVYILKKGFNPKVVLNNLYKKTELQTSFSINNIALVNGKPEVLNLKQIIYHFVDHRHEVVTKRTEFNLKKARARAHILEGQIVASENIDKVIEIIKKSENPDIARESLKTYFELSDIQAKAIVEMRLRQLTGLEQDKLRKEFDELVQTINYLEEVLNSRELRMSIIKEELIDVKERYGDKRRTEIFHQGGEFTLEDMIPKRQVVITVTNEGYIKRTLLSEYRTQNRGGIGQKASQTKVEDFLENLLIANTHQYLMFFTERGKCFWLRVFELPEGSKSSRGRPIQNLIQIEAEDKVKSLICTNDLKDDDYVNAHFVVIATKKGRIVKTSLRKYSNVRTKGIWSVSLVEGDEILDVKLTDGNSNVLLANKIGRAVRFKESEVRSVGRRSQGVRGIKLGESNNVSIGIVIAKDENTDILVISEKGYGKRSSLADYRLTKRGAKGVKTLNITEKTGDLVAIMGVNEADQVMLLTKSGIGIRVNVSDLRVMGRSTQGVKIISLREGDEIASFAKISAQAIELEPQNT